jgi:hypothetical protein
VGEVGLAEAGGCAAVQLAVGGGLAPKQARNGRVEGGASQSVSFTAILRLIFATDRFDLVFHTG